MVETIKEIRVKSFDYTKEESLSDTLKLLATIETMINSTKTQITGQVSKIYIYIRLIDIQTKITFGLPNSAFDRSGRENQEFRKYRKTNESAMSRCIPHYRKAK